MLDILPLRFEPRSARRRLLPVVALFLTALVAMPKAHAEGVKKTSAQSCDIRATDWKNFQFGKYKLKDGIKYLNKEQTFFAKIQDDQIAYGDLTKDGKLEAYVPEGECSGEWCSNLIWVFEEGPTCHPKLLTKLYSGRGDGAIVDDQYVFVYQTNPNEDAHPLAVTYVDGKFVDAKPIAIPGSLQPVSVWVSPASLRHTATMAPSTLAGDVYLVIDLKTTNGFAAPTKIEVKWGKFKHEATVRPKYSEVGGYQIGLKVHQTKLQVSAFDVTTDGAIVFGPSLTKEPPPDFQNAVVQLKW